MAHIVTIKDLEERDGGTYYTGPLEEAKEFMREIQGVTESSYRERINNQRFFLVCFTMDEEPATMENCNDYGRGRTSEEAWRYALGGEFGPADDEFSAFPLTHNKAQAVRAMVDHHFPKDQRLDVFYSVTGPNAVVIDDTGAMWHVTADGTMTIYRK
jgi:hypothetical protein